MCEKVIGFCIRAYVCYAYTPSAQLYKSLLVFSIRVKHQNLFVNVNLSHLTLTHTCYFHMQYFTCHLSWSNLLLFLFVSLPTFSLFFSPARGRTMCLDGNGFEFVWITNKLLDQCDYKNGNSNHFICCCRLKRTKKFKSNADYYGCRQSDNPTHILIYLFFLFVAATGTTDRACYR